MELEALDITDRSRRFVFAATFTPVDTVLQLADLRQAELPAGWFLIYRNTNGAPSEFPDYSAGSLGGTAEVPLPIMRFPRN